MVLGNLYILLAEYLWWTGFWEWPHLSLRALHAVKAFSKRRAPKAFFYCANIWATSATVLYTCRFWFLVAIWILLYYLPSQSRIAWGNLRFIVKINWSFLFFSYSNFVVFTSPQISSQFFFSLGKSLLVLLHRLTLLTLNCLIWNLYQ